MGLFMKKDSDGLPQTIFDLNREMQYKKGRRDPDYAKKCEKKILTLGRELFEKEELEFNPDKDNSVARLGNALYDIATKRHEPYQNSVVRFESLLLITEISEWFAKKFPKKKDWDGWYYYNHMPRIYDELSQCFAEGDGCVRNPDRARTLLRMSIAMDLAADSGLSAGEKILRLAGTYMMAPDMPWFRHFITKMVQAQNTYVCRIIQHMPYAEQMPMDSLGISPENDLKVLTEAAEKNNCHACYLLGLYYLEGKSGIPDKEKGLYYMKIAAEHLYLAAFEAYRYSDGELERQMSRQMDRMEKEALNHANEVSRYCGELLV